MVVVEEKTADARKIFQTCDLVKKFGAYFRTVFEGETAQAPANDSTFDLVLQENICGGFDEEEWETTTQKYRVISTRLLFMDVSDSNIPFCPILLVLVEKKFKAHTAEGLVPF